MRVTIIADEYIGQPGYEEVSVILPVGRADGLFSYS